MKHYFLIYDTAPDNGSRLVNLSARAQVGTGARAEKIRTYNFPESRVKDERVPGVLFHNLPELLEGDLDDIIDAVATNKQAELLEGE